MRDQETPAHDSGRPEITHRRPALADDAGTALGGGEIITIDGIRLMRSVVDGRTQWQPLPAAHETE